MHTSIKRLYQIVGLSLCVVMNAWAQGPVSISLQAGLKAWGYARFPQGEVIQAGTGDVKVYNPFSLGLISSLNRRWAFEASVSYYLYAQEFSSTIIGLPARSGLLREHLSGRVDREQVAVMLCPSFGLLGGDRVRLELFGGLGVGFYTREQYTGLRVITVREQDDRVTVLDSLKTAYDRTLMASVGFRLNAGLTPLLSARLETKWVANWVPRLDPRDRDYIARTPPDFQHHFVLVSLGLVFRFPYGKEESPATEK